MGMPGLHPDEQGWHLHWWTMLAFTSLEASTFLWVLCDGYPLHVQRLAFHFLPALVMYSALSLNLFVLHLYRNPAHTMRIPWLIHHQSLVSPSWIDKMKFNGRPGLWYHWEFLPNLYKDLHILYKDPIFLYKDLHCLYGEDCDYGWLYTKSWVYGPVLIAQTHIHIASYDMMTSAERGPYPSNTYCERIAFRYRLIHGSLLLLRLCSSVLLRSSWTETIVTSLVCIRRTNSIIFVMSR